MAGYLFLPATLAAFAVNLLPLWGVLYWDWDTFQLLMLYWIETVIIAFWTMKRLARLPSQQKHSGQNPAPKAFKPVGFFSLHAGMFIGVHFILLWAFFSHDWLRKVHGVGSFFFELFVAHGVWLALVLMVIVHWGAYLADPKPDGGGQTTDADPMKRAGGRGSGDAVMPIIGGLYIRIIIMQFAILGGAWISGFSGSMGPLLIVIVLKTLLDLGIGAYTPLRQLMSGADDSVIKT